jgi:hypothetical protein
LNPSFLLRHPLPSSSIADIIREAPLGQLIRWLTKNKLLNYPEGQADFQCPNCYRDLASVDSRSTIEEKNSDLEPSDPAGRKEAGVLTENEQSPSPPDKDLNHLQDLEDLRTHKTSVTVRSSSDAQHDLEQLYTQKTHVTITAGIGARPALTRTKTREIPESDSILKGRNNH